MTIMMVELQCGSHQDQHTQKYTQYFVSDLHCDVKIMIFAQI